MIVLICILAPLCISATATEESLSAHTEENGELKKELEGLMSTNKQSQDANYIIEAMDNVEIMQKEPMYVDNQEDNPVYAVKEDDSVYRQDGAKEQWWWIKRRRQRRRRRRLARLRRQRRLARLRRQRRLAQLRRQRQHRQRQQRLRQLRQHNKLIRHYQKQIHQLRKRQRKQATSVTYTRFGKSSCRRGAQLVYKGVVGGTFYTYRGGGSNYLCMPDHPEYAQYRRGVQGYSYLFGTEYEAPLRRTSHHDDNVPCAVCYVPDRSTSLMVPAKINCPRSFTREYFGYLMSDYRGHYRTEFICVDYDQEAVRGTSRNTNGALLYHVEVACGYGIRCGPYDRKKEVTCVVCSR